MGFEGKVGVKLEVDPGDGVVKPEEMLDVDRETGDPVLLDAVHIQPGERVVRLENVPEAGELVEF